MCLCVCVCVCVCECACLCVWGLQHGTVCSSAVIYDLFRDETLGEEGRDISQG